MVELKPFDFSDSFIDKLKEIREIPVHFYNREGQILIYKKEDASEKEIHRLVKFRGHGIYFNNEDIEKLVLIKKQINIRPQCAPPQKLVQVL